MGSRKTNRFVLTEDEKTRFLTEDLPDVLKWLVVGAVMWQAAEPKEKRDERCPHQRAVGMFTGLVQARALYDFYYAKKKTGDDDARASDFVKDWPRIRSKIRSGVLARYLGKPVNKRVFHAVYRRSDHSGGNRSDSGEATHLKNQVLAIARELLKISKEFARHVDQKFNAEAQYALRAACNEAQTMARAYGISIPLLAELV